MKKGLSRGSRVSDGSLRFEPKGSRVQGFRVWGTALNTTILVSIIVITTFTTIVN